MRWGDIPICTKAKSLRPLPKEMKADSPDAIASLKEGSVRSVICTGDNVWCLESRTGPQEHPSTTAHRNCKKRSTLKGNWIKATEELTGIAIGRHVFLYVFICHGREWLVHLWHGDSSLHGLFNMPWAPIAHLQALWCGHRKKLPPWNGGEWPLPQSIRGTNGAKKNLGETLTAAGVRKVGVEWSRQRGTHRSGTQRIDCRKSTCPKHLEALRPAREVSPDFPDAHCQLALTCSAWRHLYEQKEELEVRMFRVSKAVRKAGVYICRLK